jgi:dephospho-CoA kinase
MSRSGAAGSSRRRGERRRPLRIGVTGPIGCGKSTVAAWLGEEGARVVDADVLAREVTALGSPALAAIGVRFGPDVLRPDGELDRAALARVAFADARALRDLEAIVHPAVRERIMAVLADAETRQQRCVVIEAIRLVEGGLAALCDEVWLVVCADEAQRARLLARGAAPDDVARRLAAQADLVRRARPAARRVIDTSGTPEATRAAVVAAYREALAR